MYNIQTRQLEFDLSMYHVLNGALETWQQWRKDRAAPMWRDVDLMSLAPKAIPFATVVDVINGGDDYRFRFIGTASVELYKHDNTTKLLTELDWKPEIIKRTKQQYDHVVGQCEPVLFSSQYTKNTGVMAEKVNLRMPLVDGDGAVDKIISIYEITDHGMHPEERLGSVKDEASL